MSLPVTILKRSLSTTSTRNAIKHITVIGGGLMGSGIAQVAAQSGHNVNLVEVNSDILKKAESSIATSLARVAKKLYKDNPSEAEKFITDSKARIKGLTDAKEAVKDTDLVIEAIVENLDVKHKLFKALDEAAPQKTIFASNTSSLLITDIATVTNRKDRFGGLHFFNPVAVMRLLEVVRTNETSDETYRELMAFGKAIGKTCITCKDNPGFVVNRLLVPYMGEAVRMYERGDASKEDIDTAMKLGAGYPMGPFELIDFTGIDTTYFILEGWHRRYPEEPSFRLANSLKELADQGKLGRKSGEGFYKYNK